MKTNTTIRFRQFLDDTLRDRLVCGLQSSHIQKHLLTDNKIPYKKALKIALSKETAAKNTLQMTGQ